MITHILYKAYTIIRFNTYIINKYLLYIAIRKNYFD